MDHKEKLCWAAIIGLDVGALSYLVAQIIYNIITYSPV
jgi:hypothetical protein